MGMCSLRDFSFPLTPIPQPVLPDCIPLNNMSLQEKNSIPEYLKPTVPLIEGFGGGCYHEKYQEMVPYKPSIIHRIFECAVEYFHRMIGHIYPDRDTLGLNSATDIISLRKDAKQAAPLFMDICEKVATSCHGKLHFGPYVIKQVGSLKRKIGKDAKDHKISREAATQRIGDAVRSTIIIDSKKQVQCIVQELNKLVQCMHGQVFWKNILQEEREDGYIGIHAKFLLPFKNHKLQLRQIRCEVQVHFEAIADGSSFSPKERAHKLYETSKKSSLHRPVANAISKLEFVSGISSIGSSCKTAKFLREKCKREIPAEDLCQDPDFARICKRNLGFSRISMPQLSREVKCNFLKKLETAGIVIELQELPAKLLIPIQKELNAHKVEKLLNNEDSSFFRSKPCDKIILAIKENDQYYILDGTHHWAACHITNGNQQVVVIHGTVLEILKKAKEFPGAKQSTFAEIFQKRP